VPAYLSALEWIYRQRLKIATFLDVANFWEQRSGESPRLSPQNEENIEAVIVSFFSLCHAAELGTATVGKRGQPARLSVRLDEIEEFLEANAESVDKIGGGEDFIPGEIKPRRDRHFEKPIGEPAGRVFISAGTCKTENLCAALELADFESVTRGSEIFENGFLPPSRIEAMRECGAAIFFLDDGDFTKQKSGIRLRCDRVTEISVAQALFGERVLVLWCGGGESSAPPDVFKRENLKFFTGDKADWETNVKLVKYLKNLKR
jgi:hypothetical protein